jgi:hypothetical protein
MSTELTNRTKPLFAALADVQNQLTADQYKATVNVITGNTWWWEQGTWILIVRSSRRLAVPYDCVVLIVGDDGKEFRIWPDGHSEYSVELMRFTYPQRKGPVYD